MLRGLFVIGVLLAAALPAAAQRYDGVWFEVKASAKGVRLDPETAEPGKAKFKATGWMLMTFGPPVLAEGGPAVVEYDFVIVTEEAPGVFDVAVGDSVDVFGADEEISDQIFLGFITPEGAVGGVCYLAFKSKLDKEGALKKASFKNLGGVLDDSSLAPEGFGSPFFGDITLKGRSIEPEKLPFDPEAVLEMMKLKAAPAQDAPASSPWADGELPPVVIGGAPR